MTKKTFSDVRDFGITLYCLRTDEALGQVGQVGDSWHAYDRESGDLLVKGATRAECARALQARHDARTSVTLGGVTLCGAWR